VFGVVGPADSLSLSSDDDAAEEDAAGPEAEPLSLADEPAPRSSAESLFGASLDERPEDRDETAGAASAGDALGGPDEWDLFDELTGASKGPAPAPAMREFAEVAVSETSPAAPAKKVRAPRARLRLRASLLSGIGNGLGWLATVALVAIGLVRGLAPPAEAAAPAVAGVSVEALGARWVENAHLGRLYVVSGELRAAGGGSAAMVPLVLVLRDATGKALHPALVLGEPRPDRILREGGVDALRARPIELRRPLGAGEARRFEVVAWPLPAAAERFEVVASSERAGR
jgi:hypothetical protein